MFRRVTTALVVVIVAACSGDEKPKSDSALAAEAIKHADTKDVVAAFFQCLTDVAPKTPNGKEALDLDRINNAIKACQPAEEAMKAQVEATFGKTSSKREMSGRFEGLTEEAWKVVREHPYVPPTGTIPASP
jgi:hypothetical protein